MLFCFRIPLSVTELNTSEPRLSHCRRLARRSTWRISLRL